MKKILCAFVILLAMCDPAWGADSFSLGQATAHALKVNPKVQAKIHLLEQARMNVGVAQSYFWPRISLVYGHNQIENLKDQAGVYNSEDYSSLSWTKGMRASWSLFAGFMHLSNFQRSLLQVDVEDARHRQARLELAANVQLQFLSLLQARENLRTAEDAVKRIRKQLQAAEAFVKVDMAPYANVLQNKVELSRAEQNVIRVRNDIRNAEVQLNRYLGFEPSRPVAYRGSLRDFTGTVTYTEDQAIKTALYSRPDLIIAQKSVAVAVKELQGTLGQFLPRVDATYDSMSYSKQYDNSRYQGYTRRYWAIGLNFSWDVFSGGSAVFGSLGDRQRLKSLRKDYEDAISAARAEVIRALLDIGMARELISTTRIGVDAARESYAMAEKRYLTSVGTITELLDAQVRLTQAESDASQALADYHSARARFYFHIGQENIGLE